MTNETILKKAIEKAIKKGWKYVGFTLEEWRPIAIISFFTAEIEMREKSYYAIIFFHSFAKHFWGEGKIATGIELPIIREDIVEWQYRLLIMVSEKEPLKYLKKFL